MRLVEEVASVLHGDVVAGLWLIGAIAGGDGLLGDTHCDGYLVGRDAVGLIEVKEWWKMKDGWDASV